jgi:hypothetical protein
VSVKFRTTFDPDRVITGSVTEREDLRAQGLLVPEDEAPVETPETAKPKEKK